MKGPWDTSGVWNFYITLRLRYGKIVSPFQFEGNGW